MVGLFVLDDSVEPLGARLFGALWNAANTITMIGDLNPLNHEQEVFMIGAMFTLMVVGGYAITVLTGVLSGDDVQAYREYRRVEKKLADLSGTMSWRATASSAGGSPTGCARRGGRWSWSSSTRTPPSAPPTWATSPC